MTLNDHKVIFYRNYAEGWVAEIPAIEGCYALMDTREPELAELANVFVMIAEETAESGRPPPIDNTEIVQA